MTVDGSKTPDPRGEISPEDREALRRRSAELGSRLDKARHHEAPEHGDGQKRGASAGRALQASAELIAGIIVGGGLGWLVDKWLGMHKPIFFVLFFLLGAAAGIMNVVRSAMREKTPPAPSVPDDEDEDR